MLQSAFTVGTRGITCTELAKCVAGRIVFPPPYGWKERESGGKEGGRRGDTETATAKETETERREVEYQSALCTIRASSRRPRTIRTSYYNTRSQSDLKVAMRALELVLRAYALRLPLLWLQLLERVRLAPEPRNPMLLQI